MIRLKKKNAFTAAVIAFGMISTVSSFATPDNNLYSASDWAKPQIYKAQKIGLLTDTIQSNYQNKITREEFSEIALKLYEELSGMQAPAASDNNFSDTQNEKVISANQLGIVNGVGGGKFEPNSTATREEVSVMLYRTLKAAKPDLDISNQNQNEFLDQNKVASWAQEAVNALTASEIISGVGNNQFNPGGITSREEAITLIQRMYENFSDNPIEIVINENDLVSRGDERKNKAAELKALIPAEMGKPYQWGGTGPNSYDCSGLVYSLYGKIGVSLPRVSAAQATAGTYIPRSELQYGDLVFFARDGKNVNHVGIYVGNDEFVHSPQTGDVVKVTTFKTGYYSRTYYTARRVLP